MHAMGARAYSYGTCAYAGRSIVNSCRQVVQVARSSLQLSAARPGQTSRSINASIQNRTCEFDSRSAPYLGKSNIFIRTSALLMVPERICFTGSCPISLVVNMSDACPRRPSTRREHHQNLPDVSRKTTSEDSTMNTLFRRAGLLQCPSLSHSSLSGPPSRDGHLPFRLQAVRSKLPFPSDVPLVFLTHLSRGLHHEMGPFRPVLTISALLAVARH